MTDAPTPRDAADLAGELQMHIGHLRDVLRAAYHANINGEREGLSGMLEAAVIFEDCATETAQLLALALLTR